MTFKVKFKVKGRGTGYRPEITPARVPKWSQTIANLPEQLIQPWPLTLRSTFDIALHLTLKAKCKVKGHGFISCSGRLVIVWDYFGTIADVISGRYPVPRLLTLNLALKVKCQVKGHGWASCWGRLEIVWNHFLSDKDVISGRYPVPRPLTLNLT